MRYRVAAISALGAGLAAAGCAQQPAETYGFVATLGTDTTAGAGRLAAMQSRPMRIGLIGFAATVYIARALGVEAYGIIGFGLALVLMMLFRPAGLLNPAGPEHGHISAISDEEVVHPFFQPNCGRSSVKNCVSA